MQLQRLANDITARLAKLLKEPPDLTTYLSAHASCIAQALHPTGLSYEMVSGNNLQRVLMSNLESLEYRKNPEQELSFQKAAKLVLSQGRLMVIEPNVFPAEGLHGLQPEDSPAPEELPLFNRTPYQHFFVPILVGTSAVGLLHVWFPPIDATGGQVRQTLLRHACSEIELYLKSRRLSDIAQELTRLSTYSHLLQELAGDVDLESVTWNIVNYARESVACDRVCVFVATDYGHASRSVEGANLDYDYELFACSGIKKPHPRSEHAVILKGVARKLTEMALARTVHHSPSDESKVASTADETVTKPEVSGAATVAPSKGIESPPDSGVMEPDAQPPRNPSAAPESVTDRDAKSAEEARGKVTGPAKAARPQIQLTLIQRDPTKAATRPREVNEYFDVLPMNWATVLPLFDRQNRVCGIVLFEGNRPPEKLETSFLHMRDLAISAGRSLGTSLHWNKHQSLRIAQRWISFRYNLLNTSRRRLLVNYVLPVVLLVGVLLLPITYEVKGDAAIVSATQTTLPVLSSSRLVSVSVQEGQRVTSGELLATFDTTELQLQHRQALQEYQRALVESDAALAAGNEAQMQMARLSAAKASATAEKIANDIRLSSVRAPFDGMVLGAQSLANRIGQYFRQGEPVFEIVDPRHWQVKIALREQDIDYMEVRLHEKSAVPATLKLAADPAKSYPLTLTKSSQLAYGLDVSNGKYFFGAVLPLDLDETQGALFKSGFTGRASFAVATRPVGYVLFRDFANFIRLKFL
jgi:hypothetical protein